MILISRIREIVIDFKSEEYWFKSKYKVMINEKTSQNIHIFNAILEKMTFVSIIDQMIKMTSIIRVTIEVFLRFDIDELFIISYFSTIDLSE